MLWAAGAVGWEAWGLELGAWGLVWGPAHGGWRRAGVRYWCHGFQGVLGDLLGVMMLCSLVMVMCLWMSGNESLVCGGVRVSVVPAPPLPAAIPWPAHAAWAWVDRGRPQAVINASRTVYGSVIFALGSPWGREWPPELSAAWWVSPVVAAGVPSPAARGPLSRRNAMTAADIVCVFFGNRCVTRPPALLFCWGVYWSAGSEFLSPALRGTLRIWCAGAVSRHTVLGPWGGVSLGLQIGWGLGPESRVAGVTVRMGPDGRGQVGRQRGSQSARSVAWWSAGAMLSPPRPRADRAFRGGPPPSLPLCCCWSRSWWCVSGGRWWYVWFPPRPNPPPTSSPLVLPLLVSSVLRWSVLGRRARSHFL